MFGLPFQVVLVDYSTYQVVLRGSFGECESEKSNEKLEMRNPISNEKPRKSQGD